MDEDHGGRTGKRVAEELILRTISAHAGSLLRTARRHSLCADDAQDAYQRALEIFMGRAERLDPVRAAAWLHVVVKREAQAIRRARQKQVASEDVDLDQRVAPAVCTPEERMLSFDMVGRSAEALKRLKPHELQALWLRAQGHSYNEIGSITGWSYTKVNRCITEGRRSFLERYAEIESGQECARWLPVISALVDGEATPEQILDLRPHLRNCAGCRGTLKALQESPPHISAVLAAPFVVVAGGGDRHLSDLAMRVYESVAAAAHDRIAHSISKVQALFEITASGKMAAVAASAAAVAGGGLATVERPRDARLMSRPTEVQRQPAIAVRKPIPAHSVTTSSGAARKLPRPATSMHDTEFGSRDESGSGAAPEFRVSRLVARSASLGTGQPHSTEPAATKVSEAPSRARQLRAPEFASGARSPEFTP